MFIIAASDGEDAWVGWLVVAVIAVPVIFIIWWQNAKVKKNLTDLAQRLGFPVTPKMRLPSLSRSIKKAAFGLNLGDSTELGIQGALHGHQVRFSRFTTGSGKTKIVWAELAVSAHARAFAFSLRREYLGWKLVSLFGFTDVKIGDEVFDQRWRIKTTNAATLQALLLPELRAKISNAAASSGDFYLENDWIRYREKGSFSNDKVVARLEGMVPMMCDLAEAIDVAAEKYSPPPLNS